MFVDQEDMSLIQEKFEKMEAAQKAKESIAAALGSLGSKIQGMGVAPRPPMTAGLPSSYPWSPLSPGLPGLPADPWTTTPKIGDFDEDWVEREIERQKREAERQRREAMDAIKWQYEIEERSRAEARRSAERQAEQARGFAEGVEQAQSALGARHFLRQALGAGHELGIRRAWAAISERGWEAEALGSGKSETLLAAALGSGPAAALAFLAEVGFEPGAKVATQALRAAMAGNAAGDVLEALCRDFGAGALDEAVLADLERRQKGLRELARSRAEAYELGALAPSKTPAGSGRPKRL